MPMPPLPRQDPSTRRRRGVAALVLGSVVLLVGLLGGPCALAQIPGLGSKADASAPAAPEPSAVPIADIASRADADEALIQGVIRRSGAGASTAQLGQELAEIRRDVDAFVRKTEGDRLAAMPLINLETLDRYLRYLERKLRQWQADQQAATRPVSGDAAALVQMRKRWFDTEQDLAADSMPALAQRVDGLLKSIAEAERALSQPLTQLLALGRDASALHTRLSAVGAAVRARIATIDQRLWQRDADNLISALARADRQEVPIPDQFFAELRTEADFIDEFDRNSRAVHNGVLVFALLMLPVVTTLSVRARRVLPADPGFERFRKVLTRPVSSWLLVTLSLLIAVHYFGPATRTKVLVLLAWLPIMRLQPDYIRSMFGRGIYFSGLFIVLAVCGQLITSMSLLYRLVVLLSSVSMLAVLAWLLRHLLLAQREHGTRVLRMMRNLLAGGCAALVVAVASNVIGNLTLAAMLTEATLVSAYSGLYLMAAGNVVRGWLRFVLQPTTQRLRADNRRAGRLFQVLSQLFELALFLGWLYATLEAFRVLRPLQDWMTALFAFSLGFGNFSVTVGGIALFWVSVFLSFWIAKTVRGVLAEDVLPRMTLPRGVANSASTMTYYVLLIAGLMVALTAAGFEVSQLALVLGALSVGIGFGLQTVVNNFVSGLILMFERPIQPGDTVEVAGTIGTIRDIGMRATTFITFEGADVVVPNGMLLSEKLINWTLSNNVRRFDLPVGVAYGSDPAAVAALLDAVAKATEGVLRHPAPTVLFTGFGASSLDFSVRGWATFDDHVFVRSRMALAVHAALREAGIEVPFPQQDLHLKSVAPDLLDPLRPGRGTPDS